MSEKESQPDNGLEAFTTQALRLHKQGAFENLLCQHLIMSVASDPLLKVRLVCEAGWLVNQDKIGLDLNLIETIYTVTLSFLNSNPESEFLSMAWGFSLTLDNYERFIAPWRRVTAIFFRTSCDSETREKKERLARAESEAAEFYLMTHRLNLSYSSFHMLKSEFLRWALPLVMEIFEKLSRLVQPDLYKEMLQMMRGEITKK